MKIPKTVSMIKNGEMVTAIDPNNLLDLGDVEEIKE